MRRLKPGELGEREAERWFISHGWHMIRSQPAIQILGVAPGRRYGTVFTCRMVGRGGTPDYSGYEVRDVSQDPEYFLYHPLYRAVEVKEATGASMPCSRLDKAQREFMKALPAGCAHVGIFWTETGKFEIYEYKSAGSYKRT